MKYHGNESRKVKTPHSSIILSIYEPTTNLRIFPKRARIIDQVISRQNGKQPTKIKKRFHKGKGKGRRGHGWTCEAPQRSLQETPQTPPITWRLRSLPEGKAYSNSTTCCGFYLIL